MVKENEKARKHPLVMDGCFLLIALKKKAV